MPEMRPSKPVVRVELKPAAEPPPERVEPAMGGGAVRLPTNTIYITIAVALVLVVVAIVVGVQMGKSTQAKQDEQFMRRPTPNLTEPGADTPGSLGAVTPPGPAAQPNDAPEGPQAPASGSDPRIKGLNYLYLAVLSQSEAERAGKFLRDNKVQAYATAMVDTKGSQAKNGDPLFRLFVVPGFAGPDLKKTAAQNLEAEVFRLGKIWKEEHHGTSNFGEPSWEKFQ
jgi:hypothetical protein